MAVEQCLETIYSFFDIKFWIPKFNAQRGINWKGSWQGHKMAHISVSFAQIERRWIARKNPVPMVYRNVQKKKAKNTEIITQILK